MFCTLKAGNGTGEAYAFEATPPPFSKKREGKTSKVACTNCRTSKLRCSGEPGCCRRCSTKKFDCDYPSPRGSSRGKELSPQPPIAATGISESPVRVESPYEIPYSSSLLDAIPDFDVPGLPTPDATTGSVIDEASTKDTSLELEALWQKHQTPTAHNNHTFSSDLAEISDMVFETSHLPSPKQPDTGNRPVCSCVQQAMSTNEAIEVAIWGQKELSNDTYDILQQQKAALSRCEDLLRCQICCMHPPYVMLVLSMCRKLLETLDKIRQRPSRDEDDRDTASSSGEGSKQRKRQRGRYGSGGIESRQGYGISIRERQLDDDDEHLVLQSLISIRMKMLDCILSKLDTLVSQYNWPVHRGVCRELRISLNAGSFA